MISAPLMVQKDGDERLWGVYAFAQLPSPGDRINVLGANERVQRLAVAYVQHEPLHETLTGQPDRHSAWVHAEFIDEFF